MSINRLNPAACNNSLEIAPALANINFDFSIWKVEAPKESKQVGSHLSAIRRDQAEIGQVHMTARKLGALFESMIPSTPNLKRCYGQRASEICQVSALSPETREKYGMFSDRVGSDATSIWAAATSGSAAIAVHLLACLLARMFDNTEAIAIWDEIVRRRKEAVYSSFDQHDQIELADLQASRQTIDRAQLAEWDASARAWLRVADQVKRSQHTQLKLVLENVNLSVNQIPDTYESVMEAWKKSLTDMEHLLQGMPQQASHGDVLLGVSAWHLYPDMVIMTSLSTHIDQNDPLFDKKGLLTIGLEPPQSREHGISWSLPLKYLRFYGAPVVQTNFHTLTERSRLTLDEFLLDVLGCVIAVDCTGAGSSTVTKCYHSIAQMVQEEARSGSPEAQALLGESDDTSWVNILFKTATHFMTCGGTERLVAEKLVLLGRRWSSSFIRVPEGPLFGVMNFGRYVAMLKDEED